MRRIIPTLLFCCLFLSSLVGAQSAPTTPSAIESEAVEPSETEAVPEFPSDDVPNNAVDGEEEADQGQGETSWERMNAERQPDVAPSPAEEPPSTFSPLVLWRMLRSVWSKDE
jgi:hypothetical protein